MKVSKKDIAFKYLVLVLLSLSLLSCAKSANRLLHFAAMDGDVDRVADLVGKGGDVNDIGVYGMTPLVEATYYGFAPTVRTLLKHGADPNIQDKDKRTALHYAAASGRKDIVKILLDGGADPAIEDIYGRTAEMHAEDMKQGQ